MKPQIPKETTPNAGAEAGQGSLNQEATLAFMNMFKETMQEMQRLQMNAFQQMYQQHREDRQATMEQMRSWSQEEQQRNDQQRQESQDRELDEARRRAENNGFAGRDLSFRVLSRGYVEKKSRLDIDHLPSLRQPAESELKTYYDRVSAQVKKTK